MNVQELIQKSHDEGVTLAVENGELTFRGPKSALKALKPALQEHKGDIMRALAPTPPVEAPEAKRWPVDPVERLGALLGDHAVRQALDRLATRTRGFWRWDAMRPSMMEDTAPLMLPVPGSPVDLRAGSFVALVGDLGPRREGGPLAGTIGGRAIVWNAGNGALGSISWTGSWSAVEREQEEWTASYKPYIDVTDAAADFPPEAVLTGLRTALEQSSRHSWGSIGYQENAITMGRALGIVTAAMEVK
jgi:hypothetical protein